MLIHKTHSTAWDDIYRTVLKPQPTLLPAVILWNGDVNFFRVNVPTPNAKSKTLKNLLSPSWPYIASLSLLFWLYLFKSILNCTPVKHEHVQCIPSETEIFGTNFIHTVMLKSAQIFKVIGSIVSMIMYILK